MSLECCLIALLVVGCTGFLMMMTLWLLSNHMWSGERYETHEPRTVHFVHFASVGLQQVHAPMKGSPDSAIMMERQLVLAGDEDNEDQDWPVDACLSLQDIDVVEAQQPDLCALMFQETEVLPMACSALCIVSANLAVQPKASFCRGTGGFMVDFGHGSTYCNILASFWKESVGQNVWSLLGWEASSDGNQLYVGPAGEDLRRSPLSSLLCRLIVDSFRRLAQKLTSEHGVETRIEWASQTLWHGRLECGISSETLEMLLEAASSMFVGRKYFTLVQQVGVGAQQAAVRLAVTTRC